MLNGWCRICGGLLAASPGRSGSGLPALRMDLVINAPQKHQDFRSNGKPKNFHAWGSARILWLSCSSMFMFCTKTTWEFNHGQASLLTVTCRYYILTILHGMTLPVPHTHRYYILTILHVVHYHKANTTTEAEGGWLPLLTYVSIIILDQNMQVQHSYHYEQLHSYFFNLPYFTLDVEPWPLGGLPGNADPLVNITITYVCECVYIYISIDICTWRSDPLEC